MLKSPPSSKTMVSKLALSAPGAILVTWIFGVTRVRPLASSLPSKIVMFSAANPAVGLSKTYPGKFLKAVTDCVSVSITLALRLCAVAPVSQEASSSAAGTSSFTRMSVLKSNPIFNRLGLTVSIFRVFWNSTPPTFTLASQLPVGASYEVAVLKL